MDESSGLTIKYKSYLPVVSTVVSAFIYGLYALAIITFFCDMVENNYVRDLVLPYVAQEAAQAKEAEKYSEYLAWDNNAWTRVTRTAKGWKSLPDLRSISNDSFMTKNAWTDVEQTVQQQIWQNHKVHKFPKKITLRGAGFGIENGKCIPLVQNHGHWETSNGQLFEAENLPPNPKNTSNEFRIQYGLDGSWVISPMIQDSSALYRKKLTGFLQSLAMLSLISGLLLSAIKNQGYLRSTIRIAPDFINFPVTFAPAMNFRTHRLWSDISTVSVSGSNLALHFRDGGFADVEMNRLGKDGVEQLALATEMRASEAAGNCPELRTLLDTIHDEKHLKGEVSFTQLWEESMRSRFSPVAFVPLEPEASLQNGTYKIARQISFGGLSAVYLAQMNACDFVIVKESSVPYGASKEAVQKAEELLQREGELLLRIDHPQIVKVRDNFRENGRTYLVMNYVSGENLRKKIQRDGPLKEEQAIEWMTQLTEIIKYLHGMHPPVIHRDITPDNIVLKEDGKLVLIDFGAANEFLSTVTGTMIGKQGYMPPEQFRGKATTQSDIYALGCTMHFLLTGGDPEPLSQPRSRDRNPAISNEVEQIILACTEPETNARIKNIDELTERLQQARISTADHIINLGEERVAHEERL